MKTGQPHQDVYTGRFSIKTWSRIVHALETYCITEEQALKQKNVGDREWQELSEYEDISRYITMFILPLGKSNET